MAENQYLLQLRFNQFATARLPPAAGNPTHKGSPEASDGYWKWREGGCLEVQSDRVRNFADSKGLRQETQGRL